MSNPPTSVPRLTLLRPRLRSVGVTGTNGKSSTTSMIAAIVAAAGETSARATTLGTWVGERQVSGSVSMASFQELAQEAVAEGVRTIAVETTSKALAAGFARLWPADVAVFTNLTRDHLDLHGSPEGYLAAKAQLFMTVPPGGTVVWNLGDPCSALLNDVVPAGVRRFGWVVGDVHPDCAELPLHLRGERVQVAVHGTRFDVSFGPDAASAPALEALAGPFQLGVVGAVHAENALAAALATAALGYEASAIRSGLRAFRGVPGRFDVVAERPLVVVDYAHTPDALARTLAEARGLLGEAGGRLVCVFGCGGDRDQGKRPEMGRIASELADVVIATSDNPRGEDPERILDAIESGRASGSGRAEWLRLVDRRAAIRQAIGSAHAADVVVIAGRGHEAQQLLASGPVTFSDRDVAREAIQQKEDTA
ncbi:MAG: UDP-N-acetylmuramoyl-L-alanyl-D-glutamate--2,6-diaminopimelate ligase [Sandaracinaceae bacterium]|nr:UDP-N-acetylmuramoyl-L-alanyl-D-glutamate--2,6-diaminopimelate ligase [Sandaracinaceae bacterium]